MQTNAQTVIKEEPATKKAESWFMREVKGLGSALIIALIIRTFFFQPFNIPTGSMYPTLMIGDFLIASKYTYGYSRYAFPFFTPPLPEGRILEFGQPKMGEIVIFNNPKDKGLDYIKRVVGLPGDRIQLKAGVLHINGEPVRLRRIEDYQMMEKGQLKVIPHYIETLPNGLEHPILKEKPFGEGYLDDTPEVVVPEGHYYVMGDNRDNSGDSRIPDRLGCVPATQFLGRAEILFFSTDAKWYQVDQWLAGVRLSRFFTVLR